MLYIHLLLELLHLHCQLLFHIYLNLNTFKEFLVSGRELNLEYDISFMLSLHSTHFSLLDYKRRQNYLLVTWKRCCALSLGSSSIDYSLLLLPIICTLYLSLHSVECCQGEVA